MSRTSDLAVARLRMLGRRWESPAGPGEWGAQAPAAPRADAGQARESGVAPGSELVEPHPGQVPRAWLRLGVLVVVLSLAFAAWSLVASWPREGPGGPMSGAAGSHAPTSGSAGPAPGALSALEPLSAPSPSPSLTVHVVGGVRHPGVVSVPAGSRVADAVAAAGGLRKGAKLGTTNLARVVADGERVEVGAGADAAGAPGSGSATGTSGAVSGTGGGGAAPLIDLNTASAGQLDALPGIGPVTSAKILAWRTEHGRFTVVDELAEVPGIGPKTLEELRPLVRV